MGAAENTPNAERALIARNVKRSRLHQGLSQTELARRANVDLASVYRVEKGIPIRASTLKKIATGLEVIVEDLLIEKIQVDTKQTFAVHRAAIAKWYAGEDRRHRIQPDDEERIQESAERRRLGKLGLVPWFMCPPMVIPENGPGVVHLEIYGEILENFNAEFYEDGALSVMSGGLTVTVGNARVDLSEGDWIAFKTKDLKRMQILPPHDVALAMWIGATRRKKRG